LGIVDGALLVAALTGGTAVLASWVTSRGKARAARVQAEASALAGHRGQVRQIRRAAYLDFLEQAHIAGELHYRLGDIYAQLTDRAEQLARIRELRSALRDAFDPLMRAARVVVLEGPAPVAQAAAAVRQTASDANSALWHVQLDRFIEASRAAVTEMD
jgi:hypothetical protein